MFSNRKNLFKLKLLEELFLRLDGWKYTNKKWNLFFFFKKKNIMQLIMWTQLQIDGIRLLMKQIFYVIPAVIALKQIPVDI